MVPWLCIYIYTNVCSVCVYIYIDLYIYILHDRYECIWNIAIDIDVFYNCWVHITWSPAMELVQGPHRRNHRAGQPLGPCAMACHGQRLKGWRNHGETHGFMVICGHLWWFYGDFMVIYGVSWWFLWHIQYRSWLVGGLEYIGNVIIPIDFNIFQRGSNHQPDEYVYIYI